jgi:hypothetical protein
MSEMPFLPRGDAAPPSEKGRAAAVRALQDEELWRDEIHAGRIGS